MSLPTLPQEQTTTIAPGLHVGHARQLDGLDLDCVLTLSNSLPAAPITLRERRFPWGSPQLPDDATMASMVGFVDLHWGVLGQNTLIRDLTGLNRSCLIAGIALLHRGFSHADTMQRLQQRSPLALSNGRYRALFDSTTTRRAA